VRLQIMAASGLVKKQRDALLVLPESEDEILRHYSVAPDDLAASPGVGDPRPPELRAAAMLPAFPGRYLRRGELLPGIMPNRLRDRGNHTVCPPRRHPVRAAGDDQTASWLPRPHKAGARRACRLAACEAIGLTDGRILLDRLIDRMRAERTIMPGAIVIERLAASAMHAADATAIAKIRSPSVDEQMIPKLSPLG
jgi:hypothetical protein